jgi:hypothetical protein
MHPCGKLEEPRRIRAPLLLLSFGPCHSRCLVSSPFNDDFIAA